MTNTTDLGIKYICRTSAGWHVTISFNKSLFRKSSGKLAIQKNFADRMFGGKDKSQWWLKLVLIFSAICGMAPFITNS